VRDEAEIRGHRRTYVAALPGQIMQGLRRAGANDPVVMLDEVDKLGRDVQGDPAAALMEVLDPEQNNAFRDHYLDVPFDLSRVLFICTANLLEPIQAALRDRLEVIELPGYSDHEKLEIGRRYLVPKQVKENGLVLGEHIAFEDEALSELIRGYTAEAGVRGLERQIATLCRRRARQIASDERPDPLLRRDRLSALLGPPTRLHETELEVRPPGVAAGLAWTSAGGELLFVEAVRIPDGKGQLTVTGQLGPTMQESAQAAFSWVKAHAPELGIPPEALARHDVHVHVPAGGVPKDGPSAGLAMVSALASLLTGRPCRRQVAMTGEISLSGRVLPIGGLKAKVLAARREGILELVLPAANEPHYLDEVPPDLREGLGVHFARSVTEGLGWVLEPAVA
jgi:ATP-dependent Lon protease